MRSSMWSSFLVSLLVATSTLVAARPEDNIFLHTPTEEQLVAFKAKHFIKPDFNDFTYAIIDRETGNIPLPDESVINVAEHTLVPRTSAFSGKAVCRMDGAPFRDGCPQVSPTVAVKFCETSGRYIKVTKDVHDPSIIVSIRVREFLNGAPVPELQGSIVGDGMLQHTATELFKIDDTVPAIYASFPPDAVDNDAFTIQYDELDPEKATRKLLSSLQESHPGSGGLRSSKKNLESTKVDGMFRRDVVDGGSTSPGMRKQQQKEIPRQLQNTEVVSACTTCSQINLALSVDSTYCARFGGGTFNDNTPSSFVTTPGNATTAEAALEALIEEVSDYYEVTGICTRLRISYLEIFCDPNTDPYTTHSWTESGSTVQCVTTNSGCSANGALDCVENLFETDPARMSQDWDKVLGIFGYPGNFNSASGCAYVPGLYSSNLLGFASEKVVGHEIGHNLNCPHTEDNDDPADDDDGTCLMRSGAGTDTRFCAESVRLINEELTDGNTCARTGSPSPRPTCACDTESAAPSASPSLSNEPSAGPSASPSMVPSHQPSMVPSSTPSKSPSVVPSSTPSKSPSVVPSSTPSKSPSMVPSHEPSLVPSSKPTRDGTAPPSVSNRPSMTPSLSAAPSMVPSAVPSLSAVPSGQPSATPSTSQAPSSEPSAEPSLSVAPSQAPSSEPSSEPSLSPSTSQAPSSEPSAEPSLSLAPSLSQAPSGQPSATPSTSQAPSSEPSSEPSLSMNPSSGPTQSNFPSSIPSAGPTSSSFLTQALRNPCEWDASDGSVTKVALCVETVTSPKQSKKGSGSTEPVTSLENQCVDIADVEDYSIDDPIEESSRAVSTLLASGCCNVEEMETRYAGIEIMNNLLCFESSEPPRIGGPTDPPRVDGPTSNKSAKSAKSAKSDSTDSDPEAAPRAKAPKSKRRRGR